MEVDESEPQMTGSTSTGLKLSADTGRLFRVYKTVAAMLHKRGYMVPRELRDLSPAIFVQRFTDQPSRDAMTMLVEKDDDETNQLFVFFPEDEKVGVKPIKVLTDRMKDEDVHRAILVMRQDITPLARQAVQELSDSFRIETFKESDLLIDITEHCLVSFMTHYICIYKELFAMNANNRRNFISFILGTQTCSSNPK